MKDIFILLTLSFRNVLSNFLSGILLIVKHAPLVGTAGELASLSLQIHANKATIACPVHIMTHNTCVHLVTTALQEAIQNDLVRPEHIKMNGGDGHVRRVRPVISVMPHMGQFLFMGRMSAHRDFTAQLARNSPLNIHADWEHS